MKMKSPLNLTLLGAAIFLSAPMASWADDIEATVTFRGSVVNNPGRQTLQGVFNGTGNYDPIDGTANIRASMRTVPGERAVKSTVLGDYPILLAFRAIRGDEIETDNFKGTVILYRRSIAILGYGKVVLNRPINPRKPSRQNLSGRGRFEFDE